MSMKLSIITEQDGRNRRTRVYDFDYANHSRGGDPRPRALFLGGWWHPNTGNRLVGAVNLNYLNDAQTDRIRRALPQIFGRHGNLKSRANAVEALIPDVFHTAYRTYDIKHVGNVTLDTVHFMPPEEADRRLDPASAIRPEPTGKEAAAAAQTPEVPEIPEMPEEPEVPETPEAPEIPQAPETSQPRAATRPELAAPEIPSRLPSGASTVAGPEVPGAPGFRPTSMQRRAVRPEVEDEPSATPSASSPTVRVKQDQKPKPTSYQRRKGILGKIKDKVTGWGSALGDFLSKWRKKKPG